MKQKTKNRIDLVLNALILLCTAAAVGVYFTGAPDVLGSTGAQCFRYFTTDSNVLAAAAAAVMLIWNVRRLRDPDCPIPKGALMFKYVATVSAAITFITVVIFLAPMSAAKNGLSSYLWYFEGNIFALHFSTPVLAMLSLVLFEKEPELSFKDSLWALLPTAVYALVYGTMVLIVKSWTDWYGFTFGGQLALAPLSVLAMLLLTLGVANLLRVARGKRAD